MPVEAENPAHAIAPYQKEGLERLVEHHRVSMRGPHGLGKTAMAAWAVLWFLATRPMDTKVPTTASAWRQLEKFLWPEIRKWYKRADWEKWADYGGAIPEMLTLSLKSADGEAFALASDNAELIEGAHARNLLYIFDESKAIPVETWDAAEGAFSTDEGDLFWLAISTPGNRGGRFYEIHRRAPGLEDWWVKHVTLANAIAAGRVSQRWAESRAKQWGIESAVYQARVLGEFPSQESDALISLNWVEAARIRELSISYEDEDGEEQEYEKVGGLDVAWTGADDSALFIRQGPVVLSGEGWHGHNLMETAGRAKSKKVHTNVDVIGIGAGVFDRLREQGHPVSPVNVSKKARNNEDFINKRAEEFWSVRGRFENGEIDLSRLPQDIYDRLSGELTAIKFLYTSSGKIQIESKDKMKKRLGRSPDYADALMLAFAPTRSSGIHLL